MNSTTIIKSFFIIFLISICMGLFAQPGISVYTDAGSNNISKGIFIRSAAFGSYKYGKYNLETGFQADLKNNNKNGVSGYTIIASRNMAIKAVSFELKGFFIQTFPSEILVETNCGAMMEIGHKRFGMAIGTNFRTYDIRQKALSRYEIDNTHTKIHEIYNLMYSFEYNLKTTGESWNLGLSLSNIDNFNINQETNPIVNLNGRYKLSAPLTLYMQASYKSAGVTNLVLNYFGFYFRTGIIWNIN